MLKVNEIFYSIQGESSLAGAPCVFVRLTYCNLRCTYCDTEYAFHEGTDMSVEEVLNSVAEYNCDLVEVTGGEPMMQEEVTRLMSNLCDAGYRVLLETGGSLSLENVDPRVKKIVDFKCPGSKMAHKNDWKIVSQLHSHDEVKFVVGDRADYEWSKDVIEKFRLSERAGCILFSPVFETGDYRQLAEWVLQDKAKIPNIRMQLQLHKFIWSPETRGV